LISAENAQSGSRHGGLKICARKSADIVVGPWLNRHRQRIAAMIKIDSANVAPSDRKANAISPTGEHLCNCLIICPPCRRIAGRRMTLGIVRAVRRLRPFFPDPEPAPAQPYLLVAQMLKRGREFGNIAVIGLRLR